MIEVAKGRS